MKVSFSMVANMFLKRRSALLLFALAFLTACFVYVRNRGVTHPEVVIRGTCEAFLWDLVGNSVGWRFRTKYENGQTRATALMRGPASGDKRLVSAAFYAPDGRVVGGVSRGNGTQVLCYENGQFMEVIFYTDGLRTGPYVRWRKDGSVSCSSPFLSIPTGGNGSQQTAVTNDDPETRLDESDADLESSTGERD